MISATTIINYLLYVLLLSAAIQHTVTHSHVFMSIMYLIVV